MSLHNEAKIDSSFYIILPWVPEGYFFKKKINSLQSPPFFLFTQLPTHDALWERLTKERK